MNHLDPTGRQVPFGEVSVPPDQVERLECLELQATETGQDVEPEEGAVAVKPGWSEVGLGRF